ncbi:MAG TPA: phosphoglucosamine mutase, partial [Alphaproteobacteria bacterium]|nr:phosphoglucosamine mutase [Alphaproteobacteria bacterium]
TLPTPAVATLTRSLRADLGVMITASHNPFEDNGIKLFGPDGMKLNDDAELQIESLMERDPSDDLAQPRNLGRAKRIDDAQARYLEIAKATFPRELRLSDLRIVVDCANGSAYKVAPTALWELGAEVIPMNVKPDGFNINDGCGAVMPQLMAKEVVRERADLGIAFDGDADRLIICDEKGQIVDGDQLLGLIAGEWNQKGRLKKKSVVSTVMSNLGLEHYLESQKLKLDRTKVGDRYVLERMRKTGANIGGEQSGHLILSDFSTTGDGLIAALQVLEILVRGGKRASEACRVFEPIPQILKNVRVARGSDPLSTPKVKAAIAKADKQLNGEGRILVRASGTEPVIRIMAEGDRDVIEDIIDTIAEVILAEV